MTVDRQRLAEAYVYLLGRALVVRQELIDRSEPGFAYNRIKYNPLGSAEFVNPNLDVAYLEAWVAVDDHHAAILDVPRIEGRYYTAQLLDEWGEVIVNINERSFPAKPFGRYALCKPGSSPPLPADAMRIDLHAAKAKLLARVELKGDDDGALRLQRQFALSVDGVPDIAPPPPLTPFDNDALAGAALFHEAEGLLAGAPDLAPGAAALQQRVRAFAAGIVASPEAHAEVDRAIRSAIVPALKGLVSSGTAAGAGHWIGGAALGRYGADYRRRTVVNYAGIWANTGDEVIYFSTSRDADGERLDGSRGYVLRFPASDVPAHVVDAYWSIILVDAVDYRVVRNPLERYNLNSDSPLAIEGDGSLVIGFGPEPPADVAPSNWLPSSAGVAYALTLRTYVPKDIVKRGAWSPPDLHRVA